MKMRPQGGGSTASAAQLFDAAVGAHVRANHANHDVAETQNRLQQLQKLKRAQHVHAMECQTRYLRSLARLAEWTCICCGIDRFGCDVRAYLDAPGARDNEVAIFNWLKAQFDEASDTKSELSERALVDRLVDTLRDQIPTAAVGDLDALLNGEWEDGSDE